MMPYSSRTDAGRHLGRYLVAGGVEADLVLGLPRGGVIVAAAVARELQRPLDVLLVRKLGHPHQREFAVGALAEDGTVVLDEETLSRSGLARADLDALIATERERLDQARAQFCRGAAPRLRGRRVLIVDDGLATGATAEAAVQMARRQGAAFVLLAAPVASASAVERLARVCDAVRVPWIDPAFEAVGQYYLDFTQTTDAEVLEALRSGPE
jgi:putative phosphoribosyl transferase